MLVEWAQAILWELARVFVTGKCIRHEKFHVLGKMQWRKYEQIIYDKRCDNIVLFALNIRGESRISDRRFGCIKVCGFALLILSQFFFKYPMKKK